MATPLGILKAKLQLGYGGQSCHCLFITFLYNMSLYLHVQHLTNATTQGNCIKDIKFNKGHKSDVRKENA